VNTYNNNSGLLRDITPTTGFVFKLVEGRITSMLLLNINKILVKNDIDTVLTINITLQPSL
jgi:hypothetical protein